MSIFWCVPFIVLSFILGGQINKLFRPIGVTLSILIIYLFSTYHVEWAFAPSLWYAFTLTLGNGPTSKLMKWFKSEQKVRIVLGLSSALPILLTVGLTHNLWALCMIPVVVAVECIRMGKWFSIGKFDILPVDIFRGLALGLGISLALL